MRQNKIMAVLLAVLCLAVGVLVANLVSLYRNVYYIPEQAVTDLCSVLAEDGIRLDESLVPRKRESGILYVSDGTDYEPKAAVLLSGSEIKNTYAIPDGSLYLHYNGDITSLTSGFRFHYRRGGIDGVLGGYESFDTLAKDKPMLEKTGGAAMAAKAFLDRQEERFSDTMDLEVVVDQVRGSETGTAYVRCLRRIGGVEITENAVVCVVEAGVVTEAAGRWCFVTEGTSYMTQLSDITNILFTMKRTLRVEDGTAAPVCMVTGLERCYSMYFLGQGDGFCLIPCWRIETNTEGVMVFSALDGTLYTKTEEIS